MRSLTFFFLLVILISCNSATKEENTVFEFLPAQQTNINFINSIVDSDSLNILNYEYLYNGGGVAVLDVNNDGLNDLFFTGNQRNNALFLNKGNFVFEDISISAGIGLPDTWCTGVSVIDINGDGYDDIYVSVGGPGNKDIFPNKLFINQKDNTFQESAEAYGLADKGESIQALFFDYDLDGDADLYLLTGGGFERSAIVPRPILENGKGRNTDRLYKNTYDSIKGHPVFENVSNEAGITIEGFGLGVAEIDANQDGWPDIYVSNDYISRDLLYINNQNGTFTDQSLSYLKHTSHFSMGNDVGDLNNDGLMDILTLDMLPKDHKRKQLMSGPNQYDLFYMAVEQNYGYQYMRNMLQLNHGQSGFSEVGQLAGIDKTDWSWAPLIADFDNDGLQDIYITNGYGKDVTDLDFVNFRRDAVSAFSDKNKVRKLLADSLSQRPSVIIPNFLFNNNDNLQFSDVSKKWGIDKPSISNGAVYADLDADGDLEIIVNNMDQPAFILKNNSRELDSLKSNYLNIELYRSNPFFTNRGTTVKIYTGNETQTKNLQTTRGFQSSVEDKLHFGLGKNSRVDSVLVLWPDHKRSIVRKVKANQTLVISDRNAFEGTISPGKQTAPLLIKTSQPDFKHKETPSNDFRIQPLLQQGYSYQGPHMAIGDVNGDGLEDVFIGGAYRESGAIYIQNSDLQFNKILIDSESYEDLGAIFFDATGDGNLDLYVTSGGSERYAGHEKYQDRLYLNDGKGNFSFDTLALPEMLTSTSTVASCDFDLDGDLDLFVGGRLVPGKYPTTPQSYLLENVGGKFLNVTNKWSQELEQIGMVTSALWMDINNDTRPDLIVAGEFMPVTVLQNNPGGFVNVTEQSGLVDTNGMWSELISTDIDNDGDLDLVAGNMGLNHDFNISEKQPLELHFADFDNNGSIDPIFSAYENGIPYPITSLDLLSKQLPFLKKKLLKYYRFATTTTPEILQILNTDYKTLSCTTTTSLLLENKGNGQFVEKILPLEAQFAPINGILTEDVNGDELADLIIAGNNYNREVVKGRHDAFIGYVLINQGDNSFKAMTPDQSGFVVKGDARDLAKLKVGETNYLLATQNNNKLLSFKMNFTPAPERELNIKKNEKASVLTQIKNDKNPVNSTITPNSKQNKLSVINN